MRYSTFNMEKGKSRASIHSWRGLLLILALSLAVGAHAQCLSGNCTNGNGKYDFGWCVYEGAFKNGKPDGQGTMKYSDYAYTGTFRDGVEDGEGNITYPDGRREPVRYIGGKKVEGPAKFAASDYKPVLGRDEGCISGDCNNGFGTYQFPSGNKYVGNFRNRTREGQGTFFFSNGEQFTGQFHSNNYSSGTYTFSSGATYTGTYDSQNNPLNGTVTAGDRHVPIANGKAIVPKVESYGYENTAATRKAEQARSADKPKVPVLNWGSSSSSSDASEKAARDVQKMLDHMDRPTYTHW